MAATGRRIAREMILPDSSFIRREATAAWRDFYAPFKSILDALHAFGNAKPARNRSSYANAGMPGAVEVVIHKSENDALFGGTDFDVIYGGSGEDMLFDVTRENLLFGGSGEEVLFGEGGDGALFRGSGKDVLLGGRSDKYFKISFAKPILPEAAYIPLGDSDSDIESDDESVRLLQTSAKTYTIEVRGRAIEPLGAKPRRSSVGDVANPYSITVGVVSVSNDDPRGAGSSGSKPSAKRSRP